MMLQKYNHVAKTKALYGNDEKQPCLKQNECFMELTFSACDNFCISATQKTEWATHIPSSALRSK